MESLNFTLTKMGIRDYGYKHSYAQMMFNSAWADYVAARCLSYNFLIISGFPLFAQAIEKLLKTIIFLETGRKTILNGIDRHNPYLLKKELVEIADYDLDKYDDVLKKLYGHFQQRYHDNKDQSNSMGTDELDKFDELWMYLSEQAPFPMEVRYRLQFAAQLFDKKVLAQFPHYRIWATHQNKAIVSKLDEMERIYIAVENHYLSSKD